MKKYCLIHTSSQSIEYFNIDTLKSLKSNGFEIHIISNLDSEFEKKYSDTFNLHNINMKRGISFINMISSIVKIYAILKKHKMSIMQYSTPNGAFYGSFSGFLANVKIRIYSQWGLRYLGLKGPRRFVFKYLEKLTCKFSTLIQPDSKSNLEYCINEKLYKRDKAYVIWNGSAIGVDLEKYDISKKNEWKLEISNALKIDTNKFIFGYVGRLNKDKGINELLKAFDDDFNDCILLIIGEIDYFNPINIDLYEKSLMKNNVIYLGKITDDIQKYYSVMNTLILPSYREGFGMVLIEAQSMGVPVITTNINGIIDAMIPNCTGLTVEPKDSVALKSVMTRMMSIPLENMSTQAAKFARENFNRKVLISKIIEDRIGLISE